MSINFQLIEILEKASKNVFINSVTICLKLLENIINNPKEEKFKKFKKSNPKISNDLLKLDGMEILLLDIGFELDNGEFILRRGGLGVITKLKSYRDHLQKRLEFIKNHESSVPTAPAQSATGVVTKVKPSPVKAVTSIKIVADKPFIQRISYPQVLVTSNSFLRQIEQLSDSFMQYEDVSLQKSALQIIPVEKLKLNAIEKLRSFQKLIKQKEIEKVEPPLDDLILEELAAWFKNEFFTWVNNMDCKICKGDTKSCGGRMENGCRIEQFMCDNCHIITEFPRYNDIEKLLVSRKGRCGEFANCFTFFCRCLGYDARYIYSTGDHVWTEVYNHIKKRFIHIDPSENVLDSPLMYEHGWKKKLDYVIGFSHDDIQDVTWRYSNQHKDVLLRRKECKEAEIMSAIMEIRKKRQMNVSVARKKFLTLRTLAELGELLIVREPTEDEKKGRSSGSISWRLARGETNVASNHEFKLKQIEKDSKEFNLRYSCAKNCYERFIGSNVIGSANDWKTWEYKSENIFRKVEHDHKMVYLSRTEDSEKGMILWKFDFSDLTVKSMNLIFDMKTFETGKLTLSFLDSSDKEVQSKDNLLGTSKFSISVHFEGGKGDCAWQHAQLFRQKSNSEDFPFQLLIKFN